MIRILMLQPAAAAARGMCIYIYTDISYMVHTAQRDAMDETRAEMEKGSVCVCVDKAPKTETPFAVLFIFLFYFILYFFLCSIFFFSIFYRGDVGE